MNTDESRKDAFFNQYFQDALEKEKLRNKLIDLSLSKESKLNIIKEEKCLNALVELAGKAPYIYDLCRDHDLNDFWNDLLSNPELLKKKLKFASSTIKFSPQSKIPHFDLIAGMYYYFKYFSVKEKFNIEKQKYLLTAEQYGFFPAIDELNKHDLKQLASSHIKKLSFIEVIKKRAERAALLHGTPGYLTLAYTTIKFAKYIKHTLLGSFDRISATYRLSLIYLETARLLEPHCQTEINNAYFGQGIAASNEEGFDDLTKLKFLFTNKLVGHFFNEKEDIPVIEGAAKILSTNFKKLIYKDMNNDLDQSVVSLPILRAGH